MLKIFDSSPLPFSIVIQSHNRNATSSTPKTVRISLDHFLQHHPAHPPQSPFNRHARLPSLLSNCLLWLTFVFAIIVLQLEKHSMTNTIRLIYGILMLIIILTCYVFILIESRGCVEQILLKKRLQIDLVKRELALIQREPKMMQHLSVSATNYYNSLRRKFIDYQVKREWKRSRRELPLMLPVVRSIDVSTFPIVFLPRDVFDRNAVPYSFVPFEYSWFHHWFDASLSDFLRISSGYYRSRRGNRSRWHRRWISTFAIETLSLAEYVRFDRFRSADEIGAHPPSHPLSISRSEASGMFNRTTTDVFDVWQSRDDPWTLVSHREHLLDHDLFRTLVALPADFRVFHSQNRRARLRSNRRSHASTNEKTPRAQLTVTEQIFLILRIKRKHRIFFVRSFVRFRWLTIGLQWSQWKALPFSFRRRLSVLLLFACTSERANKWTKINGVAVMNDL